MKPMSELTLFSYREFSLWGGKGHVGAHDTRDSLDPATVTDVLKYLKSGRGIAAAPMLEFDVHEPEHEIGSPTLVTDGVWVWNGLVTYYIEKFRSSIPSEFLQRMQSLAWNSPSVSASDGVKILKAVRGGRFNRV